LLAALGLLAGCSGSAGEDAASTTAPTTVSTTASRPSRSSTGSTSRGAGKATDQPEEFNGPDFYTVPDPMPGSTHGDLIRYQQVKPPIQDGATTYRVMYRSESLEGDPIAVTGTVLVPDAAAPEGGRRLLTLAHGTTGIADECAPSKSPGSELYLMTPAIEAGWLVAMTDYEGLGTPGRHPYLVGESEGRGAIDAIVAAGALPDADPGKELAIAGYSQGGHGALWADEVAPDWAPDLEVVGTFAGAPATELDIILAAAPTMPVAGFAYMMIAGFGAAYPEADPAKILTPAGVDQLDKVDTGCGADLIKAFAGTDPKEMIRPNGPSSDPWKRLAQENNPGQVKTPDPVLILHSKDDDVVPAALSALLLNRMCKQGQVVERRVLTGVGGHTAAAPGAYADALEWLSDRFDGTGTPVDSCAGSTAQPSAGAAG